MGSMLRHSQNSQISCIKYFIYNRYELIELLAVRKPYPRLALREGNNPPSRFLARASEGYSS